MNLRKLVLPIALVVGMVGMTACDSSLNLSLNAKQGDRYLYKTSTTSDMKMEFNGQAMKTKQNVETEFSMSVEKVDAQKNMTVKYTYDAIKMDMDSNGQSMKYDSKSPDKTNPLAKLYEGMIGKGFDAVMTSKGQVTEVKGIDEMINAMIDGMGEGITAEQKQQMKTMMEESFGDESIKATLSQSTQMLPTKTVKVGDTWEKKFTVKSFMPIEMNYKYTLEKVDDKNLVVAVKGEYASDATKEVQMMGVGMKPNLKGTVSGTIKINKNDPFITEGEVDQTIVGKLGVSAKGQSLEIPMDAKITSKYSTVKK